MLVFWKHKLVLLSVPNTGPTAYHKALGPVATMKITHPPALKHMNVANFNKFHRPMMEHAGNTADFEIVAMVRDPISWLGSWYRYRQRDYLDGHPNSTKGMSFDTFCRDYLSAQRPRHAQVGSQAQFFRTAPGAPGVTRLFKYENQWQLNRFLKDRLETNFTLSQVNVSPKMDLILSPDTKNQLHEKRAADFDLWNRAT
jgi:hypothetical protein